MRFWLFALAITVAACGGGGGSSSSVAPGSDSDGASDTPPQPPGCVEDMFLEFQTVSGGDLNTEYVSNTVIADQLCGPRIIDIASSNGTAYYSVDDGPWLDGGSEIDRDQSVRIRMTSAPTFGTRNWASLTIGQVNCYTDPLLGRFCVLEGATSEFEVTTAPGSAADAPIVNVIRPADGEMVNTTVLTVSGTATDADGVAEIRVNGDLALTENEFSTWTAEILLVTGTNEIIVSSADSLLNRQPEAAVLTLENTRSVFYGASAIDMVAGNRTLYVIDAEFGGLVAVDTETDEWSIVSYEESSHFPFVKPRRLLVDEVAHRAWVIDREYDEPIEIDLMTGDRRLLVGAGESLTDARDLALDEVRNNLLVLAQDLGPTTSTTIRSGRIVTVDLATGDRQRLSDNTMPPGDPEFFATYSIHFEKAGDRLVLVERGNIVEIDPVSGARQQLWGGDLYDPVSSDLDATGNRLIIAKSGLGSYIQIDLSTAVSSDLIQVDGIYVDPIRIEPRQFEYDQFEDRIFFTTGTHVGVIWLSAGEVVVEFY